MVNPDNRLFPAFFKVSGPKSDLVLGGSELTVIAGPCALESLDHSLMVGEFMRDLSHRLGFQYIFKGSFDKDGRSSPDSFHGVGLDAGLEILSSIRSELGVPVTTDFSVPTDARDLADVIDLIQVPAYLCRQTSILRAAAETGLPVHLKKGQFMSPKNLKNSGRKLKAAGADSLLLTDRGTFFGYGDLVNDFRAQLDMARIGVSGYDVTHSIQQPTTTGSISTGVRDYIPTLTRAAIASGASVLFMEVHDNPTKALGDPGTVLDLRYVEQLMIQAQRIHETVWELKSGGDINPKIDSGN